MEDKSCYICAHFGLCRLRDHAAELVEYFNKTGSLMGVKFHSELYELMSSKCFKFKKEIK